VSALAAFAGVAGAVRRAVRLAAGGGDATGSAREFSTGDRRTSRRYRVGSARRFAWRCATSSAGRCAAASPVWRSRSPRRILIVPNSFRDGIAYVIDFQWDIVQRQTVTLSLVEPGPPRAHGGFSAHAGVPSWPSRSVLCRSNCGPVRSCAAWTLQGSARTGTLSRVIDAEPRQLVLPARGIVISAKLAEFCACGPGDEIIAKVLEGRERELAIPVVGLAEDFAGTWPPTWSCTRSTGCCWKAIVSAEHISSSDSDRWSEFLHAVKRHPAHRRLHDQKFHPRWLSKNDRREHRASAEDVYDVRDDRGVWDYL
jgi:putative ABC transport system permease protein